MLRMVPVPNASRDTISKKDSAFIPSPIQPNQLISDAEPGTGTTKCASPAQADGSSTPKKSVLLSQTNAKLMLRMEIVPNAIKDMTSKKDSASSLTLTTPDPLILDAVFGTGTIKCASPAQVDGSPMLMEPVCPYLTNAKLTPKMETVLNATKDMTSPKDNASSLPSTTPSPLTPDVDSGIGTNKSALNAPTSGPSTLRKSACQFLINVNHMTIMVPVLLVSRDTILRKECVSSLSLTTPSHLISDAVFGIGTTKNV